ncbi:MAG TPA: lipopolysaccharide transport periplasmic protein LptA [Steroidobacteraceae bacterium]|nr:lipopolysaccharide transport periplasmic protein LptA [Steroidobacteraceae bacterium]
MAASTHSAGLAACAALLASLGAGAAPAVSEFAKPDARLPIDLQAASSDFDYKQNTLLFHRIKVTQGPMQVTALEASASGLNFANSEWQLHGDVQIVTPDGKLESASAQVTFRDNLIAHAIAKGSPATFEHQLKDRGQLAKGRAATIDYDVPTNTVRLTGDAWLSDGQNEIRGNTLVYDILKQRVLANPNERDAGGVHIIINPKNPPTTTPHKEPAP